MNRILSSFVIVLLICVNSDVPAQNNYSVASIYKETYAPADGVSSAIAHFTGSVKNDRVLLSWSMGKNDAADRFEVERSSDGKNFVMAALVFGSNEQENVEFQFYEKARKAKSFYRIKVINKDNTVDYSTIISP